METITLNRSIGRTRKETLGGREYIVAPLSMLVPGVLNGSRGPLLYPPELVNKNPAVWNHMPIVVYHPMEMGKPTSARDPYILNKQGIGFVFRSRENGRAEGWFDVENTKRVDPRVYDALIKNQPMELSTGLFTKNQKASPGSSFRGKKYVEIVKDFTPDHLAILPDQKGACSMKDGCGMLINKDQTNNFNPDQPRDAEGQFTSGGGSSGGGGSSSNSGASAPKQETPIDPVRLARMRDLIQLKQKSQTVGYGDHKEIRTEITHGPNVVGTLIERKVPVNKTDNTFEKSITFKWEKTGKVDSFSSKSNALEAIKTDRAIKVIRKQDKDKAKQNPPTTNYERKSRYRQLVEGLAELVDNLNPLHPMQPRKKGKFIAKPEAKANEGAETNSHETVKNMQEPGETTKLANKLAQLVKNQNLEGSQFGKPHNTVKEKPNMAKRQVNNEEVELTEDDREELIDMIVGNCECETAMDKETLNNLSDEMLSRLALNAMPPQMMKGKKKVVAEEEESEEEMMDEEEVPVKNSKNKNAVTMNKSKEGTPKLDAKTQFLVNYAERKMQEEKDALIEKLTANVSEEDMEDMVETLNEEPIEKLERMVKLLPKEEKREPVQNNRNTRGRTSIREEAPEPKGRNFTGAGGALPKSQARQVNNSRNKADDDDPLAGPLESPVINYAEVAGYNNGTFIHRNNLGSMASSN